MYLSRLLYENEYICPTSVAQTPIAHITSDPRDIRADTLFVLTKGVRYPTETLLPLILAKAPALLVAEEAPLGYRSNIPLLLVANARRALSMALFRFCELERFTIPIIGVTGTNGKTTTASMLVHILSRCGHRVGAILTGGIFVAGTRISDPFYSMTTPDPAQLYPTLKRMKEAGCAYIVMEVSSHALALEKLTPLRFAIGIFTNISADHLDFHGDMEAYYQAKARLFSMCEQAIINADDTYAARLQCETACLTTTVGVLQSADVMAQAVEDHGLEGFSYLYKAKTFSFLLRQNIPGLYNVYNSLCALTAAIALGIAPCEARRHAASAGAPEGRMESVHASPHVYIDYAHTPEALKCALKTVNKGKKQGQKTILVFGCGGDRDKGKRAVMAQYAQEYADTVIVTTDNCRTESPISIVKDTVRGFTDRQAYTVIMDRAQAIRHAVTQANPDDIVLIAGKGHERYTQDAQGYHPFDERKIVSDVLDRS